jgi:hypothetical protein
MQTTQQLLLLLLLELEIVLVLLLVPLGWVPGGCKVPHPLLP